MRDDDRRKKRSQDPLVALHYQLAIVRARAALDAVVVADARGVVVAGAGSWAACEELAAYAPLLRREGNHTDGESHRVVFLRAETTVTSLELLGQELLVCARGGGRGGREATLDAVRSGVERILAA